VAAQHFPSPAPSGKDYIFNRTCERPGWHGSGIQSVMTLQAFQGPALSATRHRDVGEVYSAQCSGIDATPSKIEVNAGPGTFAISKRSSWGLPDGRGEGEP